MALKHFKPVTPSLRQLVIVDRSGLYKGKPVKTLTEGKSSSGGRNNNGRVTVRFRGGGHKQSYRLVDFKRSKRGMSATVERRHAQRGRSRARGPRNELTRHGGPPQLNLTFGTCICCSEMVKVSMGR